MTKGVHSESPGCYLIPIMNLMRRAISETVRQLGINFPTTVIVILAIGFTVIIARTFTAPETNSVTSFALWLIKSIGWLSAVVVVFVPFFAWNTLKVARQDRSASAHLRMTAASDALVDDRMKSFLRNTLINPWYGVTECYAFGSVVRQYQTRDVDIVIQFESSEPGKVRIYRDRLRNIERLFQEHHALRLHVQTFLATENEALHRFLNDAGTHERII